jgi:hypothetical protein
MSETSTLERNATSGPSADKLPQNLDELRNQVIQYHPEYKPGGLLVKRSEDPLVPWLRKKTENWKIGGERIKNWTRKISRLFVDLKSDYNHVQVHVFFYFSPLTNYLIIGNI